ncbi:hypothetical protein Tco_1419820 [Tanacetum coccineum]|uniref:Uncharacterized protein n=1 Tax=Tanacetum coccineum TaxID=301880 RepID=A0ABQ5I1M3_9ASTR
MKNAVLNEWILDSFDVESDSLGMSNDLYSRDLEEYKSVFDNKIAQLAEETGERVKVQGDDPEGNRHARQCPEGNIDPVGFVKFSLCLQVPTTRRWMFEITLACGYVEKVVADCNYGATSSTLGLHPSWSGIS